MFVKKLVEKASKKPGGIADGIKPDHVDPHLVFHYGIPSGSILLAYHSSQQILGIAMKDGRIKLYGKDYTQAILESTEAVPSKFLKFFENQGILINVNTNNHIEVWDIRTKFLSHVHILKEEITSFTVMQQSLFMYAGDSAGNVSILKLDKEPCNIVKMNYIIPFSASHGNTAGLTGDTSVMHILPQPTAESKRVLIIYRDGCITLWALQESKAIFTTGGTALPGVCHETKKVTAACWACPIGSKMAVGYSNGEIFIWSVPPASCSKNEPALEKDLCVTQSAPILKLNLGYKLNKIPIASLNWAYADGKASRLYVRGMLDASANLLQVVILNEHTETRTIKLGLHLSELCVDMEIISSSNEPSKHRQDVLLVLGKSVSGDQSGMIRIFGLKPESFSSVSSFMSLQGSSKKGSNHIVQSLKLVKVNGAVLSIDVNCTSKHLAVGSDQGYVSLIDMEGPTLLYQKHMASELCPGVISLQFETCSLHGFEKNIIVVTTKDSSVLAVESDTGNTLGSGLVCPKKRSRALFMQILDGKDASGKGSNKVEGLDVSKKNSIDDSISKQLSVLLCSEKAAYVYSLVHIMQGIKKVLFKKKFHSSCCWASTFYAPDAAGLILAFSNGKIEIRSLPDLSLLKETSIRGLTLSTPKLNSVAENAVCSSRDGELIIVNGDQEMFFVSVLLQNNIYRHLESVSQVYKKDPTAAQGVISAPVIHKEKKKGIFSSVIKDMTGSKAKHVPEEEAEGARESFEDLATIFSVDNFPSNAESRANLAVDEDEVDLDIDDIDLEDPGEKPKGYPVTATQNKQKFASKFQALKGKLKEMKGKNEKAPAKNEPQDEKATVDQIKRKYGFTLSGDSSVARMAENKLSENLRKLQGINIRSTEMQDTARSFSSMAKEVLRLAEHEKRSS
ncbi:Syntaxin-binding protein [Actinidia chinensis var. chinensis]|uniref:Syntaxin-binding protein n=1 Tax=Actinidia chinensis var. chinensis TaxID=1590841 RepID=A0A2R6Q1W1_ACTCC|nr:Syntaxin-binding protein [Actinidia chinensis var. chinensis]